MFFLFLCFVLFFQNYTSKCVQLKLLKHSSNGIQRYGNIFFLQQGDLCFQSFWHVCLSQSQHWEAPFGKQTPVELKTELMEIKIKKKKKDPHSAGIHELELMEAASSCVIIKHKTGHISGHSCVNPKQRPTSLAYHIVACKYESTPYFGLPHQTIEVRREQAWN